MKRNLFPINRQIHRTVIRIVCSTISYHIVTDKKNVKIIFITMLLSRNMWACFLPSDDYYTLEPRVADKVHCENQLDLLETIFHLHQSGNYFYCSDLLGISQCIKTTQIFSFSKSANIVRAGQFVSFGY